MHALPIVVAVAILAAVSPDKLRAETLPPSCADAITGLVAYVAGKLCACRFDRGGAASGLPAGYRWDCGVLRPACGDAAGQPATLDRYPYPLPPALGIDRSPRGAPW